MVRPMAGALGGLFHRLSAVSTSRQRAFALSANSVHCRPCIHAQKVHRQSGHTAQLRHMASGSGGMQFDPSSASGAGATTTAGAAGASGAGPAADTQEAAGYSGQPKLVVFGGAGFVGSRVTEEATKTGLSVVSISRSGQPPRGVNAPWTSQVQWTKGDVFDPSTWQGQLEGAVGVISTLGGFGSNEWMYKICGESNMQLMDAAKAAGVERFVFISVHDFNFPEFFVKGYFKGKRDAESRLLTLFPSGGVALRPGFIHGTRNVAGIPVPLQAVGLPLEKVLGVLPTQSLSQLPLVGAAAVPPVSASAVGRAAVAAATDPAVPAGIMDVWKIARDYGHA